MGVPKIYKNETKILPCKNCGIDVVTKKVDSTGKEITEVLCWSCIAIEMEKYEEERCKNLKKKDAEKILKAGVPKKPKKTHRGLMEGTLKRLPKEFGTNDVFDAYVKTKKYLGEAVLVDNSKKKYAVVYRYTKIWVEQGKIEKIGHGRGHYFRKLRKKRTVKPKKEVNK